MNAATKPIRRPSLAKSGRSTNPDPYKWQALGMAAVFTLTLPAIIGVIVVLQPEPGATRNHRGSTWATSAGGPLGPVGVAVNAGNLGQTTYASSCAVCHGPAAEGVKGLGKPLRNSAFVQSQSNDELFRLVVEGRPISDPLNTTGALMPPRGAQGLSDDKIRAVVAYMKSIQDETEPHASMAGWQLKPSEDGSGATPTIAGIELTTHPGYDLFVSSCAACHGQGGQGLESLGLPLTTSGFVRGKNDKDLITFIKMGRASWDENNTTGLDMPPKGGNPAITDDQLQSIVDYMRALQKEAMGS